MKRNHFQQWHFFLTALEFMDTGVLVSLPAGVAMEAVVNYTPTLLYNDDNSCNYPHQITHDLPSSLYFFPLVNLKGNYFYQFLYSFIHFHNWFTLSAQCGTEVMYNIVSPAFFVYFLNVCVCISGVCFSDCFLKLLSWYSTVPVFYTPILSNTKWSKKKLICYLTF